MSDISQLQKIFFDQKNFLKRKKTKTQSRCSTTLTSPKPHYMDSNKFKSQVYQMSSSHRVIVNIYPKFIKCYHLIQLNQVLIQSSPNVIALLGKDLPILI